MVFHKTPYGYWVELRSSDGCPESAYWPNPLTGCRKLAAKAEKRAAYNRKNREDTDA